MGRKIIKKDGCMSMKKQQKSNLQMAMKLQE